MLDMMATIRIRRKVLRWGNAYGIRLTKADMERLGLHDKDEATIEVTPGRKENDLSAFPFLHLGGGLSTDHDEVAAAAAWDDHARR